MSKIKPSVDYSMFNDHYAKVFQEALKITDVSKYGSLEHDNKSGLINMQSQREKTIEKWNQLIPSLKAGFKPIITSTPKTNGMSDDLYAKNRKKIVEILNEKGFTINEEKSSNDFLYFSLGGYNYGLEIFTDKNEIRYFIDDIDKVNLEYDFYDDYDWNGDLKAFKDFLFDAMCLKWKYIKTMYDEYVALRNKHKTHTDKGIFDKIVNNIIHEDDEDDEDAAVDLPF